jgi:hypothetical protein
MIPITTAAANARPSAIQPHGVLLVDDVGSVASVLVVAGATWTDTVVWVWTTVIVGEGATVVCGGVVVVVVTTTVVDSRVVTGEVTVRVGTVGAVVAAGRVGVTADRVAVGPVRVSTALPPPPPQAASR